MSYSHITPSQRNELSALLRAGLKQKEIAKVLKKDRTTIFRERKRNKTINSTGYDAKIAKEKTKQRRIKANQRFRRLENSQWLENYVVYRIREYWSPEQISGRLKEDCPNQKNRQIGKDSIYKFIYNQRKDLVKYLRCQKGKYRRRYGTRIREKEREKLKKRRIDQRSGIIEERRRIGDFEGDTVQGEERTKLILTNVDRKSGYLLADKLEEKKAELVKEKTVSRFKKIPEDKKFSFTFDNGTEFSEHEGIERETRMTVFFAYPYHSWERGTNENTNGLLRQFFPKKTPFARITQKDIDKVVNLINHRPRKRLNYMTPHEVFWKD